MVRLNENGTVRLAGLQPEMDVAMYVVESVLKKWCVDTVITGGTEEFYPDGTRIHSIGSYHPRGYALDFRSREIPYGEKEHVIALIRDKLYKIDSAYDAILESTHYHIEFDIKKAFKEAQNAD